jgi:thiol-disulfide isomerase/thioredoxin
MPQLSIRIVAFVGLCLMLTATYVSYLSQIAQVPAGLVAGQFATLKAFHGIPVEFFIALWFVFLLALGSEFARLTYPSTGRIVFWSGAVAFGSCAGLLVQGRGRCLTIVGATICSGLIWIIAVMRPRTLPEGRRLTIWTETTRDWKALVGHPGVVVRFMILTTLAALTAQYMSMAAASTGQVERDAQLIRWYTAFPRLTVGGLTAEGKVRVVIFTDYECPFCSIIVPEFERIVQRYRDAGHAELELIVRDFPLNRDCNPSVTLRVDVGPETRQPTLERSGFSGR